MISVSELSLLAPMWIVAIGAAIVLLLTVAGGVREPAPKSGVHLAIVALVALISSGWILFGYEGSTSAFSGAILVDGISVVFGLVAIVGAVLAVIFAMPYLDEHGMSHGEFIALILLSTVGMLMLVMAGDLMTLFIGIETMSMAIYVLAGYKRSSLRSQEAALKYFIYGAFASAFIIFGMALIYGETGRLSGTPSMGFDAITKAFGAHQISTLGWLAVAFILSGFAFKIAVVPFHMWAPDVYEGAPTPATAFMAVGVKTAAFAGLLRFVGATMMAGQEATETYIQIFELFAIFTMVFGNFVAIRQKDIKRMLAYSSIAHAGYLMVGVAALLAKPDSGAMEAIAYYLFGYTVMTLGAFGVILAFERQSDRRMGVAIDRFTGMGHKYPVAGLVMALFMFSLAGMPPTAGFFGKLSLFTAALDAGRVPLVIIAVLASAVGAYYYLRVTVVMYMTATDTEEKRIYSPWLSLGLWGAALATMVVGILPQAYMDFAKQMLNGWLG